MNLTEYLAPFLAFAASIVAVVGNTWLTENEGIKKLTPTGWAATCIAMSGLCLALFSSYQKSIDEKIRRDAAVDEIMIAWNGLVSPYRMLLWELDGFQSNPDIMLLEKIIKPNILEKINKINLHGEAPHHHGPWKKNICGSAKRGYDELRRAQTIYVGILDAELITKMKDVATDYMIQAMMLVSPCGDWKPDQQYPLRLESITNFRELPRYINALISLKREIDDSKN